jgi:hypothetical protein
MARDFRSDRLRTTQIIADNAGPVQKAQIVVFASQSATDYSSGFSPGLVTTVGTDTFLFVSGAIDSKKIGNAHGTSLFGGDVVTSGSLIAERGLSGSLTQLADGTSYLVAGTNINITSASNGQVTISSTGGGGGTSNWNELSPSPRLNTTASVAIAGGLGSAYAAQSAGSDVFFFVSGTIAGAGTTGTSVIGGDLVASGSLFANNGILEVNSSANNSSLSLTSNGNTLQMVETTAGNFTLRNLSPGGQFVASVKTSAGVTSNFLDVRPNGALTGSVISIFPSSIYAGAANPFNSSDTTFFVAGMKGAKDGNTRGTAVFGGDTVISGSSYLGTTTSDILVVNGLLASDIIPDGNRTRNLGSDTARFANVYTGDLHLRNERGDYTLIEEEDCLTIRFNKTGKRYKFVLERAPEFDD